MDTNQNVIKPPVEGERMSDEKTLEDVNLEAPHPYVADLPPDPDAHLSAEERAAIVSFSKSATNLKHNILGFLADNIPRIANSCGSLI